MRTVAITKPHLFLAADGGWWCVLAFCRMGWGYTRKAAFADFQRANGI